MTLYISSLGFIVIVILIFENDICRPTQRMIIFEKSGEHLWFKVKLFYFVLFGKALDVDSYFNVQHIACKQI